jgi:hypothetical protein
MGKRGWIKAGLVVVLGGTVLGGVAMSANAATSPTISSLAFSTPPGSVFSGGAASGTFATPTAKFVFTPAAGSPTSHTIDTFASQTASASLVKLVIAPPSGTFVTGQTFATTGGAADGTHGQLAVTVNSAMATNCAGLTDHETGVISVKDAFYPGGGTTLTRLAISFTDYCNGSTTPAAAANLYAAETEVAPIPLTVKFASPLTAAPGQGAIGGTVAGYHQQGLPTRDWVVQPKVTGITGTDNYAAVATLNVDTNHDGHADTTTNATICTFTAAGTGTDSCVGTITIPTGTVAYGNTIAIQKVPAIGPPVTVATGALLQTQP